MSVVGAFLKEVKYLHMDSPNEPIPDGWEVCDGTILGPTEQDIQVGGNYQLPNLIDRFVLGANPANSAGATGDINGIAPGPNAFGGSHAVTLDVTQMPRHFHSFKYQVLAIHGGVEGVDPLYQFFPRDANAWTDVASSQGNFISYEGGNYAHSNPDSSAGGVAPFDNRPKFASLVPIMRVKL